MNEEDFTAALADVFATGAIEPGSPLDEEVVRAFVTSSGLACEMRDGSTVYVTVARLAPAGAKGGG